MLRGNLYFKFGVGVLSALVLNGCVSPPTNTSLLYKQGTNIYSKQADVDACKIESFRSIPQTAAQHYTPGASSPGTTVCSKMGATVSCEQIGAYDIPPTVQTYDMNERLRTNFIKQCLAKRGYTYVDLPYCNNEAGYKNTDPAPPISQIKCVERSGPYVEY